MDSLLKKYLNFKFQNIKWGEIKVNFKNSYEKVFKAYRGDLASNIVIKDNTKYYICAVLKDSQSMRLRTCSSITTKISQ